MAKCKSCLTVAVVGLLLSGIVQRDAQAQDRTIANRDAYDGTVGRLDPIMTGSSIRASRLIGMNIRNSAGESVGEINDIVIDTKSSRVRYAAVTYGGFLGVGNKMFAVPFEAFKVVSPINNGVPHLVLDVAKSQLEGLQGFDEDHWPDFADEKFLRDLDRRYKVDRGVNIDVDRNGVDVNVQPRPAAPK